MESWTIIQLGILYTVAKWWLYRNGGTRQSLGTAAVGTRVQEFTTRVRMSLGKLIEMVLLDTRTRYSTFV